MKYTGVVSLLIGSISLILILYFNYQVEQAYQEIGLRNIIEIATYTKWEWIFLICLQLTGVSFGLIGVKKDITKAISWTGTIFCCLNLYLLFFP